ncbi:alanine racemase [bacterium]|nr:alanine racemase [bacterium]
MDYIGRDSLLEINLSGLRHNAQEVKKILKGHRVIAVVKGNAYGHGMERVSKVLEEEGIDFFGVALLEEALELRSFGTEKPILIQGAIDPNRVKEAMTNNLTLLLSDIETAKQLSLASQKLKQKAVVHIKVDTGMGRFGLLPENVLSFVKEVAQLGGIYMEGIYSHLATSKSTNEEYARMQISTFSKVVEELKNNGYKFPLRHISNSSASIDFPEASFDIVRMGSAFLGAKVIKGLDLKSLMTLKSRVSFIKRVPPGSCISYDMTYKTKKETSIAVINMGYSDGLSRRFTKKGEVLIKGKRFPFAGVIGMNNAMIDVGDENIQIGEEVVILGRQGNEHISLQEIADKTGLALLEFPASLSPTRIPKVYIDDIK